MRQRARSVFEFACRLVRETLDGYSRARGNLMAAAMAFYIQLAMAPLILIATAAAAVVIDAEKARSRVSQSLTGVLGDDAASAVDALVDAAVEASASTGGALGGLVGIGLVAFTASRLVVQMRRAMNQVCGVDEAAVGAFEFSLIHYARRRLSAFALVLASLPILLVIFASRALLAGFYGALFGPTPPGMLVQTAQLTFSLLVVSGMAAAVFRVVPDTTLPWVSVCLGAIVTSLVWNVGNLVIGVYVGNAHFASAYGAAVSLVVIPLWLRFSASAFLCGVKLAHVHARSDVIQRSA